MNVKLYPRKFINKYKLVHGKFLHPSLMCGHHIHSPVRVVPAVVAVYISLITIH